MVATFKDIFTILFLINTLVAVSQGVDTHQQIVLCDYVTKDIVRATAA